jgi:E3 ubiquitin-protein ligase UBR7
LNLRTSDTQPEGDEEDDEARVLIPSDTYDGLICAACVEGNEYLKSKAGSNGWMLIGKKEDGEGYEVLGRGDQASTEGIETGVKRAREVGEGKEDAKRIKVDSDDTNETRARHTEDPGIAKTSTSVAGPSSSSTTPIISPGKRDIFLSHGIRERLNAELDVCPLSLSSTIRPLI